MGDPWGIPIIGSGLIPPGTAYIMNGMVFTSAVEDLAAASALTTEAVAGMVSAALALGEALEPVEWVGPPSPPRALLGVF